MAHIKNNAGANASRAGLRPYKARDDGRVGLPKSSPSAKAPGRAFNGKSMNKPLQNFNSAKTPMETLVDHLRKSNPPRFDRLERAVGSFYTTHQIGAGGACDDQIVGSYRQYMLGEMSAQDLMTSLEALFDLPPVQPQDAPASASVAGAAGPGPTVARP